MTVKSITLLSIEEYKRFQFIIPHVKSCWWLRSPGDYRYTAAYVYDWDDPSSVYEPGVKVNYDYGTIRPALKFSLELSDSLFWYKPEKLIGTKIKYGKYQWTVLDTEQGELYALCDDIIAKRRFDSESNDWGKSELKQWLETEGLKLIAEEGDNADDC